MRRLPVIMHLPQELFDLIVAFCDDTSLPTLSLTSAIFHHAARPRMYTRLHVLRAPTCVGLSAAHLARHIRCLEIGASDSAAPKSSSPPTQPSPLRLPAALRCSDLCALLVSATSLRDLRIHVPLDFDVLEAVLQAVNPHLRILHVVLSKRTWFNVRQRISVLPRLHTLCITSAGPSQYSALATRYLSGLAPQLSTLAFPNGLSDAALMHVLKIFPGVLHVRLSRLV